MIYIIMASYPDTISTGGISDFPAAHAYHSSVHQQLNLDQSDNFYNYMTGAQDCAPHLVRDLTDEWGASVSQPSYVDETVPRPICTDSTTGADATEIIEHLTALKLAISDNTSAEDSDSQDPHIDLDDYMATHDLAVSLVILRNSLAPTYVPRKIVVPKITRHFYTIEDTRRGQHKTLENFQKMLDERNNKVSYPCDNIYSKIDGLIEFFTVIKNAEIYTKALYELRELTSASSKDIIKKTERYNQIRDVKRSVNLWGDDGILADEVFRQQVKGLMNDIPMRDIEQDIAFSRNINSMCAGLLAGFANIPKLVAELVPKSASAETQQSAQSASSDSVTEQQSRSLTVTVTDPIGETPATEPSSPYIPIIDDPMTSIESENRMRHVDMTRVVAANSFYSFFGL